LCEGVPGGSQCVAWCPSKALRRVTVEDVIA
jgi:Fe-S-cluster-containing hydrogenase component 2